MTVSGECLCGGVRFSVEPPKEIGLCHCGMCRKWCGGMPFAEFESAVVLEKEGALRWWKSSPWGERGFCGECGTPLFWRTPGGPTWGVSIGALASAAGVEIAKHIFIDEKPAFYNFADNAPQKTGAQHTADALSFLTKQFGEEFLRDAMQKSRAFHGEAFAAEVEALMAKQKDA